MAMTSPAENRIVIKEKKNCAANIGLFISKYTTFTKIYFTIVNSDFDITGLHYLFLYHPSVIFIYQL